MIVKEKDSPRPTDPMGIAGYDAEKQTAFFLRRAFAESADVLVFNDIVFERSGERAQIDHLVMHQFGFVIVESKSITGTVQVNEHLEFIRISGGRREGMRSPIEQARLQMRLLQSLLNDSMEALRPKKWFGTIQPKFQDERFQVFVAISDRGVIERNGVSPPELMKSERIVKEILNKTKTHQQAQGVGTFVKYMAAGKERSEKILEDFLIPFTDSEFEAIKQFLISKSVSGPSAQHEAKNMSPMPPSVATPATSTSLVSDPLISEKLPEQSIECEVHDLDILYGRFGYYYRCRKCDGKKTVPQKCEVCGEKAKLRKQGDCFYRDCSTCGTPRLVHRNAAS